MELDSEVGVHRTLGRTSCFGWRAALLPRGGATRAARSAARLGEGHPGSSWGLLGASLGASWKLLEASWELLGAPGGSWRPPGGFPGLLEASWISCKMTVKRQVGYQCFPLRSQMASPWIFLGSPGFSGNMAIKNPGTPQFGAKGDHSLSTWSRALRLQEMYNLEDESVRPPKNAECIKVFDQICSISNVLLALRGRP